MENLTLILSENYIEELCEKYNINAQDVLSCINNAVRSYIGNAAVITDKKDGNINMAAYRLYDFKEIDFALLEKDKVKKISKLFNYYLNIAKYKSYYDNFKHIAGGLIFGNVASKIGTDYKIEIDRNYFFNIPAEAESLYPLKFQPIRERNVYKGGDYLAFIINNIERISNGNMRFVLSRTSINLTARIIENELKIGGVKTLMRLPGVITKLKTELNIPQKTIDYARELLKGEKIYVSKIISKEKGN